MSEESDRRKYARHNLELNVRLASGDHRFEMTTENVSLGGLFLLTDVTIGEVNDLVEIEIVLPEAKNGRDQKLPVRATILYDIPGRGVGLEFSWWEDDEKAVRQELHAWLEAEGVLDTTLDDPIDLGAGSLATASQIDGDPVED